MTQETFGGRVARMMREAGVFQADLAGAVGVDRTHITRLLLDGRKVRAYEVFLIADAFGIEVRELIDGLPLPAEVERARAELEHLDNLLLKAERERDAARAELRGARAEASRLRYALAEKKRRPPIGDAESEAAARQLAEARVEALEAELAETRRQLDVLRSEGRDARLDDALLQMYAVLGALMVGSEPHPSRGHHTD